MQITGENIKLKTLKLTEINQRYLNWFKDPNVKKYISYTPKNLSDLKKNTRQIIKEKNSFFFGIFYKSKHIGNLKIHNIDYQNFSASLGKFISHVFFAISHAKSKYPNRIAHTKIISTLSSKFRNQYPPFIISCEIILESSLFG